MLSTESEMELLVQHCQEVFGQGKLVPGMSNLHTPFHLEVETLEAALAKLRPSKATPLAFCTCCGMETLWRGLVPMAERLHGSHLVR